MSVKHIVDEALRLYPPTRRIYRSLHNGCEIAVDVEFLHRDQKTWGEDAGVFDPKRWLMDDEMKKQKHEGM